MQQPGELHVAAVLRAAGDLVDAVVPDGPRADDLVFGLVDGGHQTAPGNMECGDSSPLCDFVTFAQSHIRPRTSIRPRLPCADPEQRFGDLIKQLVLAASGFFFVKAAPNDEHA